MRTVGTVAWLTWEALSVSVRWRPSLVTVIVTHLVTQGLARCPARRCGLAVKAVRPARVLRGGSTRAAVALFHHVTRS